MLKKQRGTISIVALIAGGLLCVFCVPTLAQPIEIDSIEELQKIGNDPGYPLSGDYILTQDIDASVTKTWDDGAGFAPIGPESTDSFIGHFDGQGHAIVNVHINRPYKSFNVGLFGYVGAGGIVENLGIEDIHVSGRSVVGGGVGFNKGTLNNIHVIGTIAGGSSSVGGLVGRNEGLLTDCYARGDVTGLDEVGGIVGDSTGSSSLIDCHATNTVCARRNNAGGLMGRNMGGGYYDVTQLVPLLEQRALLEVLWEVPFLVQLERVTLQVMWQQVVP